MMVFIPNEFYSSPHGFVNSSQNSLTGDLADLSFVPFFFLAYFFFKHSPIDILVIVAIWKIIHVTLVPFNNIDLPVYLIR